MKKSGVRPKQNTALHWLSRDKSLAPVIQRHGPIKHRKDLDLYQALLRSIVGQQLSVKAASTIWSRFLALFSSGYPHAPEVLDLQTGELRACGLSFQKAGYIRNIALFHMENGLDYHQLKKMQDEDLISYLTQIKGVGRWTVQMIMMFHLQRPDVFPHDDLGIRNGMQMLYRIRSRDPRKLRKKMELIAESWRPYRSLACFYIWRHKDAMPR